MFTWHTCLILTGRSRSIVLIYAGRIFTPTLCWNLPEISYIRCHYWHIKTIKHSLDELLKDIERVSYYDAQYTLQVETVDLDSDIYQMRLIRNHYAAEKLLALIEDIKPEAMIVPNGTIQELGAAYRVAKSVNVPVSTYEFSDQKDCIWMAQNSEIMRQETVALWNARKERPFTDEQRQKVQELYKAKVQGDTWKNFVRHWQSSPRAGGSQVAAQLGIGRPSGGIAGNQCTGR